NVGPTIPEGLNDRRPRNRAFLLFVFEGRGLVNLTPNNVTRDDDDNTEQKRNPPAPAVECVGWHVSRERQEYGRRKYLPVLYALQSKLCEIPARPEGGMFKDHRTAPRVSPRHSKSLDQSKDDKKRRRQ